MAKKAEKMAKFKGELNRPIEPLAPLVFPEGTTIDEELAEAIKAIDLQRARVHKQFVARERADKLNMLLTHYQVAEGPQEWKQLALRLALEFVPGFQVGLNSRGRPRGWDELRLALLHRAVEAEKKNGPQAIAATCKRILKAKHWWADGVDDEKTLRNLVVKARTSEYVRLEMSLLAGTPAAELFEKQFAAIEEKARIEHAKAEVARKIKLGF